MCRKHVSSLLFVVILFAMLAVPRALAESMVISQMSEDDLPGDQLLIIAKDAVLQEGISVEDIEDVEYSINYVVIDEERACVISFFAPDRMPPLASVVMNAITGEVQRCDFLNFMEQEKQWEKDKGSEFYWSLEDKALFCALYRLPSAGNKAIVPEAGDLTQETAIEIAKKTILDCYDLTQAEIDSYLIELNFQIGILPSGYERSNDRVWMINFRYHEPGKGFAYQVNLSATDGRIYDIFKGGGGEIYGEADLYYPDLGERILSSTASLENCPPEEPENFPVMEYLAVTDVEPDPRDMQKEEAISAASDFVVIMGETRESKVDQNTVSARFVYFHEYMMGLEPVWLVRFEMKDGPPGVFKRMYTYDGIYLGSTVPGKEFAMPGFYRDKPWSDVAELRNENNVFFYDWSIEEKAAFSEKWIPIMRQYCADNRYYTGKEDFVYDATRYVYGLPGEDDLSQSEAMAIATEAAMEYGATANMMERRTRTAAIYFDITDPDTPLWKFWFRVAYGNNDMRFQEDDLPDYFILVHARTGEILGVETERSSPYGYF